VDPEVTLNNVSGIYDGYIKLSLGYYKFVSNSLSIGYESRFVLDGPERAFIEFNTSSIPDNVVIDEVNLSVYVYSAYGAGDTVTIKRLNNTQFSDNVNYPTNDSGNKKIYDSIFWGIPVLTTPYVSASTDFQTTGQKNFTLGLNASQDLQGTLEGDFFSVGFMGSDEDTDETIVTFSGGATASQRPFLTVTYTEAGEGCTAPASGNWAISETCNIDAQNITLSGNLTIQDVGILNMTGNTNISFAGTGRYIFINSGGEITIYDTSGFGTNS